MNEIYGSRRDDVGELPSSKLGMGSPADKLYTAAEYKSKKNELLHEIVKLHKYITQYMSRNLNVADALGVPGCKMLTKIVDLAEADLDTGKGV